VDGYQTTLIKQKLKNDELINQEIGKPLQSKNTEGFELEYENYQAPEESIIEGFDAATSNYNALFTQNQIIKNKIDNNCESNIVKGFLVVFFDENTFLYDNLKFINTIFHNWYIIY
jgi:hypothetical protein